MCTMQHPLPVPWASNSQDFEMWSTGAKKETLQSESMTAIDTCMQDTYRKGCENESSAKVMLHVHTCAK